MLLGLVDLMIIGYVVHRLVVKQNEMLLPEGYSYRDAYLKDN